MEHKEYIFDQSKHKEYIFDQSKQKRDKKKIDAVKSKLENIDIEHLARILIEVRKTSLLDFKFFSIFFQIFSNFHFN